LTTGVDAEFTALIERQSRFVFRVAYAVLLNAHDAEDAVQETFLKLFRNRGWQQADNERAFLARVAWRIAVDLRRRTASMAAHLAEAGSGARLGSCFPTLPANNAGRMWHPENEDFGASPLPGPEEALVTSNEHALVHAMIDALPDELRVPLVLSTFEELNSREIGRALGIPEGTVRTRLLRARQILRQKLEMIQMRPQETHHA
jgi:RNA polymerase sigma-70 factor (ECF subfamily)